MLKPALILTLICALAAAALGFAFILTGPRIEEQREARESEALGTVLPEAVEFSFTTGDRVDYYTGRDRDGEVAGWALEGRARGYSSLIRVMVGVDPEGVITGIKILEQAETPGLGDQAVKVPSPRSFWDLLLGRRPEEEPARPPFQEQFAGKALEDLEVVVGPMPAPRRPRRRREVEPFRDRIEALTGATVTSRAITDATRSALKEIIEEKEIE